MAQRMIVGNSAARHGDGVERQRGALDEFAQRLSGVRPPDAAAGDDHRPLGGAQQWRCARSTCGGRRRGAGGSRAGDGTAAGVAGFASEQVHRNRQVHGALPAGIRFRIGAPQVERESARRWAASAAHFTTGRAIPTWSIS